MRELHDELRAVQSRGLGAVPSRLRSLTRAILWLPGVVRRLLYRAVLLSPTAAKRHTGTVLLTAVGMFGAGVGWGLSAPGLHGLSVIVGGIAPRAAAAGDGDGPRGSCASR